jgi:hypothetical protein
VKPSAAFGHSCYRWRHKPCAFGWVQGSKSEHGIGQLEAVWGTDWEGKACFSTVHPTSKPTRLFEIPMEQHTRPGDVVLDCFSGFGSQIIAGEKLRRRVGAIEATARLPGRHDRAGEGDGQGGGTRRHRAQLCRPQDEPRVGR